MGLQKIFRKGLPFIEFFNERKFFWEVHIDHCYNSEIDTGWKSREKVYTVLSSFFKRAYGIATLFCLYWFFTKNILENYPARVLVCIPLPCVHLCCCCHLLHVRFHLGYLASDEEIKNCWEIVSLCTSNLLIFFFFKRKRQLYSFHNL